MTGTLPAAPTLGTVPTISPSSGRGPRPRTIEVPPGVGAVDVLWGPLSDALAGGEPIAPLPAVSPAQPVGVVDALRDAIRPHEPTLPGTAMVVTTSGSTGNPRGVELSATALGSLTDEVNALAGVDPSWVLAIPATSIGGLNVLIRSHRTGRPPVPVRSLGGAERFTDEVFAEAIEAASAHGSNIAVSLVPAQLPRLLSSQIGRAALARCSLILIGGAALAPQAARDAADAGIAITTTYGMTETSGGCVFGGRPLADVRIKIDETDDRIWIAGPMLASAYRDERPGSDALSGGWLRTNDRGRWAAGALQVLGRLDDIVTVNGTNVDIVAIEDRLRDHPDVTDAIVIAIPSERSDTTLHAAYVAVTRSDSDPALLGSWVRDGLGRDAVPATFHRVDDFPLTATGKVDRIEVATVLGIDEQEAGAVGGDLL